MRVLVCGGRNFTERDLLRSTLDRLHKETPIEAIIHGGATGADTLAGWWASINEVKILDYPADWKKHGNAAGPIRNQEMINTSKPTLVVAFAGGRGTADMVRRARKAGIPIIKVERQDP